MLLTCDIGNTNIKSGLFINDHLTEFNIFSSVEDFISYTKNKLIRKLAVSSVVPAKINAVKALLQDDVGITEVTTSSPFNLQINYESPGTLGIDRLCSCEGAFYLFKKSTRYKNYNEKTLLTTIDFGTATTINIVKYPGVFEGGIIAPGIKLMSHSLNNGTAQLPAIGAGDYNNLIGRNTKQSIASGIINSTVGMIDRTIKSLRETGAENINIYITGGNAEILFPYFNFEYIYEKALVLYGIRAVVNL